MEKERLFTAGEFAKITGVTKHTLFHYDEIGLFCPVRKGKNNYRYYSATQLEVFDVIRTMKDLDMPLQEIKQYLDERNPEKLKFLLSRELQIIEEKQKHLNRTKKWITKKNELLRQASEIDVQNISIEEKPISYMIWVNVDSDDEKVWAVETGKLVNICCALGIKSEYGIGYTQSIENVKQHIYNQYKSAYVVMDKNVRGVMCTERPAGTYVTAYHQGIWQEVAKTYDRMLSFAQENKLELYGDAYEDYLQDGLTEKSEETYIMRVSCLCRKKFT